MNTNQPTPPNDAQPYGDSWLRPTLASPNPDADAPVVAHGSAPVSAPVPPSGPATTSGPTSGPGAPPSARGWWLVAGLGATLVLTSLAGVVSWGALTGGLWRGVEEHQTYRQPVAALTVQGGAGDIEVRGGAPTGTVEVTRRLGWGPGSSRPTPRETWSGDALRIDAECAGLVSWCSIDYVVTVPDATAVTIENGSGDTTVSGALGGLTLTSGSGDIEGSRLATSSVAGRVGSGDIDLDLATAAGAVDLRSGSGDVSVRVARGTTYAVSTDRGSGDEKVSIATDPSSADRLHVETGSGDIDIAYR